MCALRMMAPITKLEAAYRDRAVIAFIDVWKHRDQAPGSGSGPFHPGFLTLKAKVTAARDS